MEGTLRRESWSPAVRTAGSVLPYAIGVANFSVVNIVYRIKRGGFYGGDSAAYLQIAEALRSGAMPTDGGNTKPLGYPLALALVTGLSGSTVANALMLNAVLYLVTIYVVGRLGRLLGISRTMTIATQSGFALVGNPSLWANLVLAETMTMAVFVGAVLLYCELEMAPRQRALLWRAGLLGALLGTLALTRFEYVVLLPLLTVLFGRHLLLRTRPPCDLLAALVAVWGLSLLPLLIQPALTGWRGMSSVLPPRYSGFVEAWAARYDFEFSHYRIYRLGDTIRAMPKLGDVDPDAERAAIRALKYDYVNGSPIDDGVLDAAAADIRRVRELGRARGFDTLHAHEELWTQLQDDPGRFILRVFRRLYLFVTAENLDWPRSQAAYWAYTIPLRPLSVLGYAFLAGLIWLGRPYRRADLLLVAFWLAFPALVHVPFNFEQRYAHPSIPLLCLSCGLGLEALWKWRKTGGIVIQRDG